MEHINWIRVKMRKKVCGLILYGNAENFPDAKNFPVDNASQAVDDPFRKEMTSRFYRSFAIPCAYLIFVIFSPRTLFFAKNFSTQKRVNRNKPTLRQNVNRQKNTSFATKQFKMQQNAINCTHVEVDFRFLHICHVKKFEIYLHVDEF